MKELYDKLFANGEYTKSFEEFKKKFSNPENSQKLFDGLSEAGTYTKSIDEFNSQFGFGAKTKDSVAVDQAVESEKVTGSNLVDGSSEPLVVSKFDTIFPTTPKSEKINTQGVEDYVNNQLLEEKEDKEAIEQGNKIYDSEIKSVPRSDYDTIDYDNPEAVSKFRKSSQDKFIANNSTIQDKIISPIQEAFKPMLKEYALKAKEKYKLNNPATATEENIKLYEKDIKNFYESYVNTKIGNDPRFRSLLGNFNKTIDERLGANLKRFGRGKDSPNLLKVQDFLDENTSPYSGLSLMANFFAKGYTATRNIFNEISKGSNYKVLAEQTKVIEAATRTQKQSEREGWGDEQKGYWSMDSQGAGAYGPKFSPAGQYRGSKEVEGTYGEFKKALNSFVAKNDVDITKRLVTLQNEAAALSNYDNDSFDKFIAGDDMLQNAVMLGGEQLPQMGLALLTFGASSAMQIGSAIYVSGIENEVKKRYPIEEIEAYNRANNIQEGTIPIYYLKKVMDDDKFMNNIEAKAVGGGFVAGQLEKFGAGKALSAFTIKSSKSILRGGMKNFLKSGVNGIVNNQRNGAYESITEVLQEIIQTGMSGGEFDGMQMAEAGGTAYITTTLFGVGGAIKNQTVLEAKTAARIIAGKLNPNSSEAVFNAKLSEIDDLIEESSDDKVRKDLTEKRNDLIEIRNANITLPKNYTYDERQDALDTILERDKIKRSIKGKEPNLVEDEVQAIKDLDEKLKQIGKTNAANRLIANLANTKKGAKNVADQLGIEIFNFSDKKSEDGSPEMSAREQIEAKKKEFLKEGYVEGALTAYGESVINEETGENIVLINDTKAAEDNIYTTEQHEVLHPFLKQTFTNNPDASFAFGTALLTELANGKNVNIVDAEVQQKVIAYLESGISATTTMEEVMNFTSEALSNKSIIINETASSKIADIFRRLMSKAGLNIRFKKGSDVLNMVRDYNKTIESGGKLSAGQLKIAKKGAKGSLTKKGRETLTNFDSGFVDPKTEKDLIKEGIDKAVANEQGAKEDSKKSLIINPKAKEYIDLVKEGILTNESLADIVNSRSSKEADKFAAIEAIVEGNWPVISKAIKFNPTGKIPMSSIKEAVKEQFQGIFPGRNKSLLDTYSSEKSKVNTFIGALIGKRQAEILERAKQIGENKFEGESLDSEQAKQVAIEETSTESSTPDVEPTIDPFKITPAINEKQFVEAVAKNIKDKNITDTKDLSYRKIAAITPYKIVADVFGIPESRISNSKDNLRKGDNITKIQMWINNNPVVLKNLLPLGNVEIQKVKAVGNKKPTTIGGEGNKLPGKLIDAFYNKKLNSKGKHEKKKNALQYTIKPNISVADFKLAFGIDKDGNVKDPRSGEAQAIKGLLEVYSRNLTNRAARVIEDVKVDEGKQTESEGAIRKAEIAKGKPKLMYSLDISKKLMDEIKELSVLRSITKVALELGHPYNSPKESNRIKLQIEVENAIKEFKLDSNAFLAMSPASGGSVNIRRSDGNVYYKLTDGEYIKGTPVLDKVTGIQRENIAGKKMFRQPEAPKGTSLVAPTGRLYYGTTDPAYKRALKAARENDNKNTLPRAVKLNMPTGEQAIDKKWIEDRKAKSDNNMNVLDSVVSQLANAVNPEKNNDPKMSMDVAVLIIAQGYQATSGLIKIAAPFRYVSTDFEYGTGKNSKLSSNTKPYREEHNPPASVVGATILAAIKGNETKPVMLALRENYYQTQLSKKDDSKLDMAKLDSTLPEGFTIFDNPIIRLAKAGIDLNSIIDPITGKTLAEINGVGIDEKTYKSLNATGKVIISDYQNEVLEKSIEDDNYNPTKDIKKFLLLVPSKSKASVSNNDNMPSIIKYSLPINIQTGIDALAKADKALDIARALDVPTKKIRVFDFDDTLARTKSNVLYTMPNGDQGAIDAATFARDAASMEAEGAVFDFSEFSKVMNGKKGPLFEVAKIIADKRGTDDVFVLTARPANAAGPIKEFLSSIGLNIPLKNITGLGDGDPQAKAGWIVGKAAEGYNDFYFADDATGNVEAVKKALSVLDVKSKVQRAIIKNSLVLDKEFNDIIQNSTGIASEKNYAKVKARLVGKDKGRLDFFIPPSAEDFVGLLYKTLGKGKVGDSQMKWYKDNLLNPYARAIESITRDRNTLGNNFIALKKELNVVPKNLKKKFPGSEFTKEQGIRVYIWNQIGEDIPGLSKADLKELIDIVENDPELKLFAQEVIKLNKGTGYATPKDTWITGTITTDLLETLNTTKRRQYLEQWQQNVDVIFSEKNLNKMEAAYGRPYRDAMENILARMKTGTNRTFGGDTLTGRFTDWLNGSTAAIMFFNSKSAILQTISSANFINFGDNNILAAGKAFANQPQYWKDFSELFNSDFLVDRRDGLKININEADIADVAKESGARGVINKLLKLGFLPTQIADSFAIASGGATFYRNRVKSLIKEGMDPIAAEKQAMRDFREIAEESQQSSRPDKISSQQAGPLGRIVLAFANTPAQYARLIKKAASDLKNGRGNAKSNISKIMYYGVVQNLIFNALQQALFSIAFGDDEEELEGKAKKNNQKRKEEKTINIANGMADSILRGAGIGGAIFSVVKNTAIKIYKESEKKNPKYEKAALELLKISPPVSSKVSKIMSAGRSFSWNMDEMKSTGFSLDNPAWLALGNTISAATNIPLDRVVKKLQHLKSASDAELETYKRLALAGGWSEWELGIEGPKKIKPNTKPKTVKPFVLGGQN